MRDKMGGTVDKVVAAGRRRGASQADLERRVAELEAEVAECRATSLRVAELTDLVTELVVPLARRDDAAALEVLERYHRSL